MQQRTIKRRDKVQYLLMIEGHSINEIAKILDVDYSTIKNDYDALLSTSDNWVNIQARVGWLHQIKDFISSTLKEITQLEKQIKLIEKLQRDTDRDKNPYDPHTESKQYMAFMYAKLKFNSNGPNMYFTEYAQLQNVITKKKESIEKLTNNLPLLHKVQNLEKNTQNEINTA